MSKYIIANGRLHEIPADELMHQNLSSIKSKNHKYVKREWKNGRWVYYYEDDQLENIRDRNRQVDKSKLQSVKDANKKTDTSKLVSIKDAKRQTDTSKLVSIKETNRKRAKQTVKDHENTPLGKLSKVTESTKNWLNQVFSPAKSESNNSNLVSIKEKKR